MTQRLLQKDSEASSDYLSLFPLCVTIPFLQVSKSPIFPLIPTANTLGQCKLEVYKVFVGLLVLNQHFKVERFHILKIRSFSFPF